MLPVSLTPFLSRCQAQQNRAGQSTKPGYQKAWMALRQRTAGNNDTRSLRGGSSDVCVRASAITYLQHAVRSRV